MYVVYQSRHAKARKAAEAIADAAHHRGMIAFIGPISDVDPVAIMEADVLVAGCTTQVDTPFGGDARSTTRAWIDQIPDLDGKPCAVFCTYSFFPHTFADVTTRTAEVLDSLERGLELKGGKVVASQGILNRKPAQGAEALVSKIAARV